MGEACTSSRAPTAVSSVPVVVRGKGVLTCKELVLECTELVKDLLLIAGVYKMRYMPAINALVSTIGCVSAICRRTYTVVIEQLAIGL